MADFRRWFIALAVLALAAGLASAQVGTAGSTQAGVLVCTANGASIPQIRTEGYTELVGDILITCTGGAAAGTASIPAVGSATPIPTTNITVVIPQVSNISSRLLAASSGGQGTGPTGSLSEAVLLIDEPGSGLLTGATGGTPAGYGPAATQGLCSTGPGTCSSYVGLDSSGLIEVALRAQQTGGNGSGANAYNMYPGYIAASGNFNTVTFYGVPVLPPVTTGLSRVFRITNIRIPGIALGNLVQIGATVTTSPSQVLPLTANSNSFPVAAVISPSLLASVSTATTFSQCSPPVPSPGLTATLTYTENFATAFKTRVVPLAAGNVLSNALYAAEGPDTGLQNIPGGFYGSFAANSESGFIVPGETYGVYTAGLADFGTRLKAIFTNIPAGVTLYVSNTSLGTPPTVIGGATLNSSFAVLVATGSATPITGEATIDSPSAWPLYPLAQTPLTPAAVTVPGTATATAVWEVTNSQPGAIDTLNFGVYMAYTPSSATTTNPYGLPQVTSPASLYPGVGVNNVLMGYAPEPSQAAFSQSAGPFPGTNPIPRFLNLKTYQGPFIGIQLCQTTLLFPFVTASPGFDTGIAIANTSQDPFGTAPFPIGNHTSAVNQTGDCTLYPYGFTYSSTGAVGAGPAAIPGCNTNPALVGGTSCFPSVRYGTVATVNANSGGQSGVGVFPQGFQGYVIAVCNFQYAHGYASVTDQGLRNLFSGYLALEIAPDCIPSSLAAGGVPVCAGRGVSIEQLVH